MPYRNTFSHILLRVESVSHLSGYHQSGPSLGHVTLRWATGTHGAHGCGESEECSTKWRASQNIPKGSEGGWWHPQLLVTQGMSQQVRAVLFHTLTTVILAKIFPQGDFPLWAWSKPRPKGVVDLALFLTVSRNHCHSAGGWTECEGKSWGG